MAITPEEAGKKIDAHIAKQVARLELDIDVLLAASWHSNIALLEVPAPTSTSTWAEQIMTQLSWKYSEAGWKIERRHDPKPVWIFRKK